jgi:hypothetical protein
VSGQPGRFREPGGQFCVELTDVVITYLDGHQLVIERWSADKGITRHERG